MSQLAGQRHPRSELSQSQDGDLITGLHLLVVGRVSERQGQHALLLQVSLVDPGEGTDDDSFAAQVSWLEGCVFSGAAFSVVLISDNNPANACSLVLSGSCRHRTQLVTNSTPDRVHFSVLTVNCRDQEVVGDVVEVTSELEPRSGGGDVICRALSFHLDEQLKVVVIVTVPLVEGSKKLQSVGVGVHVHIH